MNNSTTDWDRLRALLDQMFDVNNRTGSTVTVVQQDFDMADLEHVVLIEYRARVMPPELIESDQKSSKPVGRAPMASIRELFAHGKRLSKASSAVAPPLKTVPQIGQRGNASNVIKSETMDHPKSRYPKNRVTADK